jgi:predicted metallopeptidase
LGGTLGVSGATTLNGTVNVSGTNTLTVGTGATALGGSLTVTGATTLTGSLSGSQLKGNVLAIYSSSSPFSGGVSDHLYLRVDSSYTYLDSGGGNPFLIRGSTAAGGDIGTQTYGNIIVAQKNATSANVMIGKDTITGYNLDVSGTVNATSYNASSDYRIKENVISLNGTYVVDKLRPVEYFNKLLKRQDVGLIAHELQEIYPFLVTGDKDAEDYQSVNYTGLIGILIREVQELKKRVAVLEGNEK